MAGQQPKWKLGQAVAVWDFGDRISIKLFNWDYINVPLNADADKPKPIPKQQMDEVLING